MRRRSLPALFAITALAVAVPFVAAVPSANAAADPLSIKINEVSSDPTDFIEVVNTGTDAVDLTGWKFSDNHGVSEAIAIPGAGVLGPGELFSWDSSIGLGKGDTATIYEPDGTQVDTYTWPDNTHASPSNGRCADFGDAIVQNTAPTPGTANACPPAWTGVTINEVESSGGDPGDWVELYNSFSAPIDVSGLIFKDGDDTHSYAIPAGSTIAVGGYLVLDEAAFGFGLGAPESVRLYQPDGSTLIDSYSWTSHAAQTYGRCPNGNGAFADTVAPTKGAANDCPPPPNFVKINEVQSDPGDLIELTNTGTDPVDISGYVLKDNDDTHSFAIPAGTTLAAGAYQSFDVNAAFGLGKGDSARLYLPDGLTLLDSTTWPADTHAADWGRCPDGTGDFGPTTVSTRGGANACSPVRINEVESSDGDNPDWIELTNIGDTAAPVGGWTLKDSTDNDPYTIPAGTTIAAHGYLVITPVFGLGSADSARLFDDTGALIESYSWTAHATQTYGRCKDGTGDFVDTKAPTKGAANSCPGLDTLPWPGAQTVSYGDNANTWNSDLSGLVFDPSDPSVLWGAQNKHGTLWKLTKTGGIWTVAADWPAAGRDPLFADGTGHADTEGLTIGGDGKVYMTSERDNDQSGVSRNTVLRYEPTSGTGDMTATDEWPLNSFLPTVGANLGLEGVTYVSDAWLTARGFVDQSTGKPYRPADYPQHGTGLYFVALEDTGKLYGFALDGTGGGLHATTDVHPVATIDTGFSKIADVTFDAATNRLWAVADDTVDGQTTALTIDQTGNFVLDEAYDRPGGMPNLNNEGMALAPASTCTAGGREAIRSDDGNTDGHSLRTTTIDCTLPAVVAGTPTVSDTTPQVGQTLTVTPGTWTNATTLGYQWLSGGVPIAGATSTTYTVTAADLGKAIAVRVGGAAHGYLDAVATSAATSATSTPEVAKLAATVSAPGLTVTYGSAAVASVTVKGQPGRPVPTGTVTITSGRTTLGSGSLSSGKRSITIPAKALLPGRHTLSLSYSGDAVYKTATGSLSYNVAKKTPTVTLGSTGIRIAYGRSAKLGVTVSSGISKVTATGTVQLTNGRTVIAAGRLSRTGRVLLTIPSRKLKPGRYHLTVRYSGDTLLNPVTKAFAYQVVKATPAVRPGTSHVRITYGRTAKLGVTVRTGVAGVVATGIVQLKKGRTVIASGKLSRAGRVLLTVRSRKLRPGTYRLTVRYVGNALLNPVARTWTYTVTR